MATSVETPSTVTSDQLTPILTSKYALRWQHAVLCSVFALLFLYLSYIPLPVAGTWLHASWGKSILAHRTLPTQEPFLPLAAGMPTVSSAWLSQVLIAQVELWVGAEAFSGLLACTVVATLIVLGRVFYVQTRRKRFCLLGVLLVVMLWWSQLGILRPELFGGCCLALMLWILASVSATNVDAGPASDPRVGAVPRWIWIAVPALMIVWCNLDSSFLVGLIVLACYAGGRFFDVMWQERSVTLAVRDKLFHRLVWLTELGAVVTLIHPMGLNLWAHAIRWPDNAIWQAAGGWRPVNLISGTGIAVFFVWIVFVVLMRHSRARVSGVQCLLMAVASVGVICNANLFFSFSPLAVLVLVPHIADIGGRVISVAPAGDSEDKPSLQQSQPLRFTFTLLCLLIVWCGFALSPISSPLLGGKPRSRDHVYSGATPWAVTDYLRENPPAKLVWAPAEWGDWLVWKGPEGLQVFANSNAHVLPRQARYDYARIYRAEGNWQRTLDRYGVNTLVIDKQKQKRLSGAVMRAGETWSVVFEDERALVLKRKEA